MDVKDFVERLEVIDIQPSEYILFRFPISEYSLKEVECLMNEFEKKFPNNTIVMYPDDTFLEVLEDKKFLYDWINHIKDVLDNL